jgi:NDP-sugar pyrophosphorylase family protein
MAVLVCPSNCVGVEALARHAPLVTLPMLGQSLIEYWLTHLAAGGERTVKMIVAPQIAGRVREIAGQGERWGLDVTVHPEPAPTVPQAPEIIGTKQEAIVLDHFPGRSRFCLFSGYSNWFSGLVDWMPHALTPDRVGIREIQPQVWVSSSARISDQAELHAPCWIGENVIVGARAEIGPRAIIEERAFIDDDAEVAFSYVCPDTYVGPYAELHYSLALGSSLIRWATGSAVTIADQFLLSSFRSQSPAASTPSLDPDPSPR